MNWAWSRTLARHHWLLRLGGSAVFLAIVFWILPLGAVISAITSISPFLLFGVLILFLTAHLAAALKWSVLLGPEMPVGLAFRAHFAGLAANLALPGALGGDVVRAGLARRAIRDGSHLVAVAAVDRLIDMCALLSLAVIGGLFSGIGELGAPLVGTAVIFLVAVSAAIITLPNFLPIPWKLFPGLPGRVRAENLALAFANIGREPRVVILVFGCSLGIQCSLVLLSWWLALGVAAEVSLAHWLFAWPLAKIIAVLPVSLNGLGVREAALASVLAPFGSSPILIVASGLVWQAVLFMAGGIGALVLLFSGPSRKNRAPK